MNKETNKYTTLPHKTSTKSLSLRQSSTYRKLFRPTKLLVKLRMRHFSSILLLFPKKAYPLAAQREDSIESKNCTRVVCSFFLLAFSAVYGDPTTSMTASFIHWRHNKAFKFFEFSMSLYQFQTHIAKQKNEASILLYSSFGRCGNVYSKNNYYSMYFAENELVMFDK